jgi:hemerythrin-like domain-containing protein
MKNTIEKTMNELRTDHRNMVQLLDLLDAETVRLGHSDDPDYDLIYEIMTYMSEYPDAVHHPKEDMIYRHLKKTFPDIDESLHHIEKDHKALGEASRELRRDIDAISVDGVVSRESLAESLRKYSGDLRKHMYWEEKDLFELADTMHDDDIWAELLKSYDQAGDPLFGSQIERRFQKLFNGIQRRIVWDSQQYFV